MFIGRYYFTLESQGRISLPKSFRDQTESWVVTKGLDGGLLVFKAADFTQQLAELSDRTFTRKINRDFIRLLTNDASQVEPDGNGRVHLPEYLIEFAGLEKDIVIVGSFQYLEVWDRERYHSYLETIEKNPAQLAEQVHASIEKTQ
jgi:MraZ protein